MNRFFVLIVLSFAVTGSAGQQIDFHFGSGINQLRKTNQDPYIHEKELNSNPGFQFGAGLSHMPVDWALMSFTLDLDHYGGNILVRSAGQASGHSLDFDFIKGQLTLGIYPLSLHIWDRLDLRVGVVISRLLYEDVDGHGGWWGIVVDSITGGSYELSERYSDVCNRWTYGLRAGLAYTFWLNDQWALEPRYILHLPLKEEFGQPIPGLGLRRHLFSLSIVRKLNLD